jgi:hypothetical protein
MNRRVLRHKILSWLLRITRPFNLDVQVVRVRARPDYSAEISRWTADEFGDPKGAVDAFLVLAPTGEPELRNPKPFGFRSDCNQQELGE